MYLSQIAELGVLLGLQEPPSTQGANGIEVRIWVFGVLAYVSDVLQVSRDSSGLSASYLRWWDREGSPLDPEAPDDLVKSFQSGDYCTELSVVAGYYRCRTEVPVADLDTVLDAVLTAASMVPDSESAPLFIPEHCAPCEGCIRVSIDESPHMAIEVFDPTGHRLWGDCLGPILVEDAFPAFAEARIAVRRRYDPPMR
jgi:hypothetical protein